MELEELHDCEKCHGKMVMIAVDKMGNTYCGYCHERVDYGKFFEDKFKGVDMDAETEDIQD